MAYRLFSEKGIVRVQYRGGIQFIEAMDALHEISTICSSQDPALVIFDMRECEMVLSVEDMHTLGETIGRSLWERKLAFAIDKVLDPENRLIRRIAEKHGASITLLDSTEDLKKWSAD
jgi:hypothetical protein